MFINSYYKAYINIWKYYWGRALKETGLALDVRGARLESDISYMEELSRHRKIMPLNSFYPPVIYDSAVIEDNATLIGQIVLGHKVYVGYGCVLKADMYAVRIGHLSVVGDNTQIQCSHSRLPEQILASVSIGQNVKIGNNCIITSALIDDDVVIGDRSLVLEGSQIERGAQIGPDSYVPPGRVIPAHQYWEGRPVQFVRELKVEQISQ